MRGPAFPKRGEREPFMREYSRERQSYREKDHSTKNREKIEIRNSQTNIVKHPKEPKFSLSFYLDGD